MKGPSPAASCRQAFAGFVASRVPVHGNGGCGSRQRRSSAQGTALYCQLWIGTARELVDSIPGPKGGRHIRL